MSGEHCAASLWQRPGWPAHGCMHNGRCYRRAALLPHRDTADCTRWPTPAAMWGNHTWISTTFRAMALRRDERIRDLMTTGIDRPGPAMVEYLMGLPRGWLTP